MALFWVSWRNKDRRHKLKRRRESSYHSTKEQRKSLVGRDIIVESNVERKTFKMVKKSLDDKLCTNLNSYVQINDNIKNTRNKNFLPNPFYTRKQKYIMISHYQLDAL